MCQRRYFGLYWDKYYEQQKYPFVPTQKRHTNQMKQRYWVLPEEFSIIDVEMILGVERRNAEKMIERWHKEHYIDRIEHGRYRKVYLELT